MEPTYLPTGTRVRVDDAGISHLATVIRDEGPTYGAWVLLDAGDNPIRAFHDELELVTVPTEPMTRIFTDITLVREDGDPASTADQPTDSSDCLWSITIAGEPAISLWLTKPTTPAQALRLLIAAAATD
jgi:hypothetical protein